MQEDVASTEGAALFNYTNYQNASVAADGGINGSGIVEKFIAGDVSTWILLIYFANIALGAFLNGISFLAILRSKRNGTLSIIFQLSAVDVLATSVCIMEIWSIKSDTWPFLAELCPIFSGAETLTNTLTLYLILLLNFHTISLCNLKTHERDTYGHNPLTSCDASNECLVRDSRNITIDYRSQKRDVSIVFPCILIWFICMSLSIPQFTLSSTLKHPDGIICTVVDIYYGKLLQNLLMLFRVVIPVTLLLATVANLGYKLYQNTRKDTIQSIFTKKSHNVLYYLIFCTVLTVVYLLTSLQRLIFYSMHTLTDAPDIISSFKMPPLHNHCSGHYLTLLLSMVHYSGIFFRFLIYLFLLPKFKSLLCNKILMCFQNKN